jgi:hypothetical protein
MLDYYHSRYLDYQNNSSDDKNMLDTISSQLKAVCIEIIHQDFTAIHRHALESCHLSANLLQDALGALENVRDKARREEEQ